MHTLVILAANGDVQEIKTVVDVRSIAILLSALVPIAVQVLSKKTASSGLKALLNLIGVTLASVFAFVIDPGNTVVTWQTCVNVGIAALVTSLASYNVLKAFGISGTIAEKTKGIGFGSPPTVQTDDVGAEDELAPDEAGPVAQPAPGRQVDSEAVDFEGEDDE